MLSKDAILAAVDLPTEEVQVPAWNGAVKVRGMSTDERDSFDVACYDAKGKLLPGKSFRAELCARCIVDEAGARVFGDAEVGLLGAKSAAAIDLIFPVAVRLSGMGDQEELKGN